MCQIRFLLRLKIHLQKLNYQAFILCRDPSVGHFPRIRYTRCLLETYIDHNRLHDRFSNFLHTNHLVFMCTFLYHQAYHLATHHDMYFHQQTYSDQLLGAYRYHRCIPCKSSTCLVLVFQRLYISTISLLFIIILTSRQYLSVGYFQSLPLIRANYAFWYYYFIMIHLLQNLILITIVAFERVAIIN